MLGKKSVELAFRKGFQSLQFCRLVSFLVLVYHVVLMELCRFTKLGQIDPILK